MTFLEYLENKFGAGEPIYVDEIKFENYSHAWVLKKLKKLVDNYELYRFDRGIYYIYSSKYKLDTDKIIERRFITDGDDVYGYVTGKSLLYRVGLLSEDPEYFEVATNNETTRVRYVAIGSRYMIARKSRTDITPENARTLQLYDLMNVMKPFAEMNQAERDLIYKFAREAKAAGVSRETISQYAGLFPKAALANLIESGVIYEFA
jgi:hypothetical protein